MNHIIIGIEGLVGAGKSSICRDLTKIIPNTVLLEGGNLYRAIVYAMTSKGITVEELYKRGDKLDIKEMMDLFLVKIKIENNETKFYINEQLISEEKLQSKEASLAVSTIGGKANNKKLFQFAKNLIDELKKENNVIVSGRSLMKIYPNLDYHFFITASLEERIKRKNIQYEGKVEKQQLKQNIIKRDELQKEAGFYDIYENTITIDVTNCKNSQESAKKVLEHIVVGP